MTEALAAAMAIVDEGYRALALVSLAPHLVPDQMATRTGRSVQPSHNYRNGACRPRQPCP
jgi:hypothetical protein